MLKNDLTVFILASLIFLQFYKSRTFAIADNFIYIFLEIPKSIKACK